MNLLMPSRTIGLVNCDTSILECEWSLRFAQAHDTLHDIRSSLLLRTRMYQSKDRFSRGQKQQTRSTTLLSNVQSRINNNATKYRDIRERLLLLSSALLKVGWQDVLRCLNDADLRGLSKDTRTGEGRVSMSWIWQVASPDGEAFDGEGMQEGIPIYLSCRLSI
jgi:hypothetical protein